MQATFTPCVTLDSAGHVEIDWSSSWSNTVDDAGEIIGEMGGDEPEPKLSVALDEILGAGDGVDKLRNLLTYIDTQNAIEAAQERFARDRAPGWPAIVADLRAFFEHPDDAELKQAASDALDKADLALEGI